MAEGNVGTLYYEVEADTSKMLDSVSPMEKGVKRVEKELENLDKTFSDVEKGSKSAGKGLQDVGNKGQEAGNKLKPLPKAISEIGSASTGATGSISAFTKVMAGFLTLSMGRTLLEMADSYNEYAERVRMATDSAEEFDNVQVRLLETANNTYRALSESQEMFIRTSKSLKSMGYSTDQALDITDSLTYAFVKNAASSDRAASAVDAYSKAVIKGSFESDAWITVTTAIPTIIEDIAKAAGLSAEQIRKLGAEGKITARQMNEGLRQSLDANKAAADGMATTLNDAFRAFGNNLSVLAGNANNTVGVTRTLSAAIIGLSENLETVVTVLGILGGAALARYVAGLATTYMSQIKVGLQAVKNANAYRLETKALAESTAASLAKAQANALLGGTTAGLAAKSAAAATAATAAAGATTGLAVAGRTVLGLLGGPVGMIAAVGLTALSFIDFGKGADGAGKSLLDLTQPMEQVIAKLQEMNQLQLATEIGFLKGDQRQQMEQALASLNQFVDGIDLVAQNGARVTAQLRGTMREELTGIVQDTTLSKDQLSAAVTELINKWVEQGRISQESAQAVMAQANAYVQVQASANSTAQALQAANERASALKDGAKAAASAIEEIKPPAGMDKWDEYLAKLTASRDMIGMNARQLGEFQAAQEGANAVQQQMAGIIVAQADEFRNLQKAIEDKDTKAADAAKTNIRNLDIERQKVALLAQQMASVMAAAAAFAKAGVSGDMAAGALLAMNEGFAKRAGELSASKAIEAQISNVTSNTKWGGGKTGRGKKKGAGSKSEAQRAAEADIKALQDVRREIELNKLAGEALAQAKARDKLSEYATPAQIAMMKQLTTELYKQEELKKLREKVGTDVNKYVDGSISPLSGGVFDDQVARYEAEAQAEQQRYTDQLIRLREAKEAQLLTQQEYNDKFEQMAQTHADRVGQIEAAKYSVLLSTGENAFASLAGVLKDAQGEQSSAYKAMFAVSKGFAIANAAIAMGVALSEAWKLPWPANLAAAGVAAANMATIMANIQSVGASFGGGRRHGGSVEPSKMYRVNEGGMPEILNTAKGQFLLPNRRGDVVSNKDATRGESAAPVGGTIVNVIENPNKAGQIEKQMVGDNEEVNVFVADIRGGGSRADALEQTYGLTRIGR